MDALQEQQQTEVQQPAPQQPPQADAPPLRDEEIMARALGETPRDPKGRFTKPADPAQPQPAAEVKEPAKVAPAAEATQEEVPWDSVKDVKIKVPMKDGEREWTDEITLGQLREERMLKADYTKKTQEIAEQRRQVETHTQTAVEKERTQYLAALGALHQHVQVATAAELKDVDWNKLAAENPAEYVRLSNRAREANEAMQRIAFEQEKVHTQQAKERDERLAQAVNESKVKLKEAIPTWNDDLYQAILKRGVDTYGFKPDEVGQFYDHRVMRVMHDAHQFRLMQDGKSTAEKKVVTVPPVLKPGAVKPKVDSATQQFQAAQGRLRDNGNDIDAAAAVMAAFITPKGRPQ